MTSAPPLPDPLWNNASPELQSAILALVQIHQTRVAALESRINDLEARLKLNSTNSHKPPSSDLIGAKRKPPAPPSGKKRGGQPNHRRAKRLLVPPEKVRETITCKPTHCRRCGQGLLGDDPSPLIHQVAELPKVEPFVDEYQLHRLACPGCKTTTCASLPPGVPTGHFGPYLQAVLAVFTGSYRLSKRQVQQLSADLFGLVISIGMIAKLERRGAAVLEAPYNELAVAVHSASAVNIDETSWREDRKKAWLWSTVTRFFTVFTIARHRSGDVYSSRSEIEDCSGRSNLLEWPMLSSVRTQPPLLHPAMTMISIDFTTEQIEALHHERFHHPHPRVQEKMEAVYLKSQGLPHKDICRLSRISENTLRAYLRQFQEGGVERLKRLDFATPTSELADHRDTLEGYFRKNPPRSTAEAADAIERLTGIRRGQTQVRKFLGGMGMKFRKLGMIPAKADADEQARFLDEELWPRLKQAQRLKRVVCFVDAAHFVHGPYLGYLWCFVRLLMRGPSGRRRFNVLGAIDAVTHQLTTVCNETTINAPAICELLGKLSARYAGLPMTLVMDNARYQKCAVVQALAASLKIELLFLPPYSPNLNLIERLWKFVKKESLSCRYHEDFARFKGAIVDCLEGVEGKHKEAIQSLITLRFQTFNNPQILAA